MPLRSRLLGEAKICEEGKGLEKMGQDDGDFIKESPSCFEVELKASLFLIWEVLSPDLISNSSKSPRFYHNG